MIPREKAAGILVEEIQKSRSLPLVTISGPSGIGKSDLAGKVLSDRLNEISAKSTPRTIEIPLASGLSLEDVEQRIADAIIDNHSGFLSKRASSPFRQNFRRLLHKSPSEAAERLRMMMRSSEKGRASLKKIQLVICLDGVDGIFEKRMRAGSDLSQASMMGGDHGPIRFLAKLVGMKTVLFTMTYRSWLSSEINDRLTAVGIDDKLRYHLNVPYPDAGESEQIVGTMVAEFEQQSDVLNSVPNRLEQIAVDAVKRCPSAIGVVPEFLENALRDQSEARIACEDEGIGEYLARKAESLYLKQNTSSKLASEELFSKLIEGDGRLLLKQTGITDELWTTALFFVKHRILAVDGRSYRNARFVPTHRDLLTSWNRAAGWAESERIVGLAQIREFDDKALSWELGERKPALLLVSEQSLSDADVITRDSELLAQLPPLTREYLTLSLKDSRKSRSVLISKVLPIVAGVSGVVVLGMLTLILMPDIEAEAEVSVRKGGEMEPEAPKSHRPAAQPISIPETRDLLARAVHLSQSTQQEPKIPIGEAMLVPRLKNDEAPVKLPSTPVLPSAFSASTSECE